MYQYAINVKKKTSTSTHANNCTPEYQVHVYAILFTFVLCRFSRERVCFRLSRSCCLRTSLQTAELDRVDELMGQQQQRVKDLAKAAGTPRCVAGHYDPASRCCCCSCCCMHVTNFWTEHPFTSFKTVFFLFSYYQKSLLTTQVRSAACNSLTFGQKTLTSVN